MKKQILVVDDDPDIIKMLTEALSYEQYDVLQAFNGKQTLTILNQHSVDLIVMDIMMPELDGLETTRRIRREHQTPILLISARDREIDKVIGLEIGADDYITKPFGIQELIARIKVQLRRVEQLSEIQGLKKEHSSPIRIDKERFEVTLQNQKIDLSVREFLIFQYLYEHPNRVLSREQIYHNVWGEDFGDLNTVTVHIKNIRKKLGENHTLIKTIWGIGYQMVIEGDGK